MSFETGIAIILIAIPSIFIYLAIQLKEEKDVLPLRALFFLITFFLMILMNQYAVVTAQDNGASANIISLLQTVNYVLTPIAIINLLYVIIMILVAATKTMQNKKTRSIFDDD